MKPWALSLSLPLSPPLFLLIGCVYVSACRSVIAHCLFSGWTNLRDSWEVMLHIWNYRPHPFDLPLHGLEQRCASSPKGITRFGSQFIMNTRTKKSRKAQNSLLLVLVVVELNKLIARCSFNIKLCKPHFLCGQWCLETLYLIHTIAHSFSSSEHIHLFDTIHCILKYFALIIHGHIFQHPTNWILLFIGNVHLCNEWSCGLKCSAPYIKVYILGSFLTSYKMGQKVKHYTRGMQNIEIATLLRPDCQTIKSFLANSQ